MKIDFKTCTEEELWKYVAAHLKSRNIDTVLVGGAVVSIYTDGAYESGDLDLILTNYFVKNLPEIMNEIGFGITSTRSAVTCSLNSPKAPWKLGRYKYRNRRSRG